MRIAIVTCQEYPPDIRIEKEASSLVTSSHEVFILTPVSRSSGAEGYRVLAYGEPFSVMSALVGSLHRLLKALRPDILHVQDTPASLEGYLAARSLGLPLIFDIHEIWPSLVLENSSNTSYKDTFWSKILLAKEAITYFGADAILTVVEEAKEYYVKKYPSSPDRVFPIRNFESLDRFRNIRPREKATDEVYTVTYVGGLDGPIRGLEDVILAAALLSKENIQFLIVGSGNYLSRLQRLRERLHLDRVRFLGPKKFEQAMEVVSASDLCLIPHRRCTSTENTLPHKISQYMALRKPVVSTNLKPIKRLFDSAYIEWEPRTPQRLATIVNSIREDGTIAMDVSKRAYSLVSERHRWEEEGRRLIEVYETVSEG